MGEKCVKRRALASGTTGVCEPADVGIGISTWVLRGRPVLLTPEPSLRPWPHTLRDGLWREGAQIRIYAAISAAIVKSLSTRNVSTFTLIFFVYSINLAGQRYDF